MNVKHSIKRLLGATTLSMATVLASTQCGAGRGNQCFAFLHVIYTGIGKACWRV